MHRAPVQRLCQRKVCLRFDYGSILVPSSSKNLRIHLGKLACGEQSVAPEEEATYCALALPEACNALSITCLKVAAG